MRTTPLVSVIVPAYNAARFIEEALASVQAQTYPNVEVLVVDDGSDDETADIVADIAAEDDRVRLLRQPNRGVAAARNRGLAAAQGTYVAPLDADDVWFPRKLEWQVQRIEAAGTSTGLVYAWWAGIDEAGEIIGAASRPTLEGAVYEALAYRNFIGNASVPLFRRACVEQVGGYDPTLRACGGEGCEDWDLTLRVAETQAVRLVPAYLSGYRAVADGMSGRIQEMARSYDLVMDRVRRQHPEVPEAVLRWSRANFYRYLAAQTYSAGEFTETIDWLRTVVRIDPTTVLSSWVVKTIVKSMVRRWASPATTALWQDHQDWIAFKERWLPGEPEPPSIEQLQHRPGSVVETWKPRWWKPHDQLRADRWRRIKARCEAQRTRPRGVTCPQVRPPESQTGRRGRAPR